MHGSTRGSMTCGKFNMRVKNASRHATYLERTRRALSERGDCDGHSAAVTQAPRACCRIVSVYDNPRPLAMEVVIYGGVPNGSAQAQICKPLKTRLVEWIWHSLSRLAASSQSECQIPNSTRDIYLLVVPRFQHSQRCPPKRDANVGIGPLAAAPDARHARHDHRAARPEFLHVGCVTHPNRIRTGIVARIHIVGLGLVARIDPKPLRRTGWLGERLFGSCLRGARALLCCLGLGTNRQQRKCPRQGDRQAERNCQFPVIHVTRAPHFVIGPTVSDCRDNVNRQSVRRVTGYPSNECPPRTVPAPSQT